MFNWIIIVVASIAIVGLIVLVVIAFATKRRLRSEVKALTEGEEKFRTLFLSMIEGVCIYEMIYDESGEPIDYRVMDVNPGYTRHTGILREDAIGRLASDVYGEKDPPYFKIYVDVASGGKARRFERYFEPLEKYFRVFVFSPTLGTFSTVFDDITEQKADEEKLKKSEQRQRNELELAAEVQLKMLPSLPSSFGDIVIEGVFKQSEKIGGDFYGFFCDTMGIEHLLIADVAGHGVASSLFCGAISVLFKQAAPFAEVPEAFLDLLNGEIEKLAGGTGKYATAVYLQLSPDGRKMRITNAGHPPVIILGPDGIRDRIESSGLPLGLLEDASWEMEEREFARDETILMFTDGLNEAILPDGKLLGTEGLYGILDWLKENEKIDGETDLPHLIVERATELGARFTDDLTVLSLRWVKS